MLKRRNAVCFLIAVLFVLSIVLHGCNQTPASSAIHDPSVNTPEDTHANTPSVTPDDTPVPTQKKTPEALTEEEIDRICELIECVSLGASYWTDTGIMLGSFHDAGEIDGETLLWCAYQYINLNYGFYDETNEVYVKNDFDEIGGTGFSSQTNCDTFTRAGVYKILSSMFGDAFDTQACESVGAYEAGLFYQDGQYHLQLFDGEQDTQYIQIQSVESVGNGQFAVTVENLLDYWEIEPGHEDEETESLGFTRVVIARDTNSLFGFHVVSVEILD